MVIHSARFESKPRMCWESEACAADYIVASPADECMLIMTTHLHTGGKSITVTKASETMLDSPLST